VIAVAVSELTTAVPIDPPICCAVFTIADATPASWTSTPLVAAFCTGPKISPNPRPVTRRADARQEDRPGKDRHHHHGPDHRQESRAGLDRGEPQRVLEVVRKEKEHGEHPGPGDPDGQVRRAADAIQDDPQWQQRVAGTALDEHEDDQ
jgi:hypothetical protein